jgi:HD-GYP domain-containing protein (c-di-GMP phosphodiesterase class II)
MINDRPYRKALSRSKVIEEIRNNMNTQFCEESANALFALIEKGILD